MRTTFILAVAIGLFGFDHSAWAQNTSCRFSVESLSFGGTPIEQARCLLREVKVRADLENQLIPALLAKIVDQPVQISRDQLLAYLKANRIEEGAVGGSIALPISRARSNDPKAPSARYFVIHDTSTPNLCEIATFPPDINAASWKWNDPKKSNYVDSKDAHLFITRDGKSVSPQGRTFGTPWRSTKLEKVSEKTRGLFLHIENVQPRHCHPDLIKKGKCRNSKGQCNDNIAPEAGFSDVQMERLALAYIAASVRSGKWLIPAFHAAIDAGLSDGHDDPQNFNLQGWTDHICSLLKKMKANCPM